MQNRAVMRHLVEGQHIAPHAIEQALLLSEVYPPAKAWPAFIIRILLSFAVIALGCSVVFFVAANWHDMSRTTKFLLLQSLPVLAIACYVRGGSAPLIRPLALSAAFLCLGALMAYFGQTYQTGADPWQLFFNWALLSVPWVMISRFAPLYFAWLILLNLSIGLYHADLGALLPFDLSRMESLFWSSLLFNGISLLLWELSRAQFTWLDRLWFGRMLAVVIAYHANALALMAIFVSDASWLGGLVWLALMGLTYWRYRMRHVNLFMLALGCLSGIVVVVAWCANLLFDMHESAVFLLLFLLTVGLTTWAAMWLKTLIKENQA
ncbi:MAG: DUF2157 domain-containing protein [Paraglaciecola sp.]|nr:DUF2157 domain-containing protein [Paraglaciecola sp.]NCT48735.1 DUF2157 domain-containing protein [Paraglaciecola sp.]